jgi:hypothetical protein
MRTALLRCVIARSREAQFGRGRALSDGKHQLVEGGTKTVSGRLVEGDLVAAAPQVLDESVTSDTTSSEGTPHREEPRRESPQELAATQPTAQTLRSRLSKPQTDLPHTWCTQ